MQLCRQSKKRITGKGERENRLIHSCELIEIIISFNRSQSDATGLFSGSLSLNTKLHQSQVRLCLGDLPSGRAFENGCTCFDTVRGTVNGLLGQKTVCSCGVSGMSCETEC